MRARRHRRRSWLRLGALAVRAAASVIALAAGAAGGILTAYALGSDSPLVWTVAVIAGFGVGLLLMGHPALHRVAWRLEQEASRREQQPPAP